MGACLASEDVVDGIKHVTVVLIADQQALHAVVDPETVQGIGTSKEVEDDIILGNQFVEEVDGRRGDAEILAGEDIRLHDVDHHQVVGLKVLQPE